METFQSLCQIYSFNEFHVSFRLHADTTKEMNEFYYSHSKPCIYFNKQIRQYELHYVMIYVFCNNVVYTNLSGEIPKQLHATLYKYCLSQVQYSLQSELIDRTSIQCPLYTVQKLHKSVRIRGSSLYLYKQFYHALLRLT